MVRHLGGEEEEEEAGDGLEGPRRTCYIRISRFWCFDGAVVSAEEVGAKGSDSSRSESSPAVPFGAGTNL